MSQEDAAQTRLNEDATEALVKDRDRDRYWSALFAPKAKRAPLFALYAFDAELDHIAAVVSEPLAGEIRLQWWRDVVEFAEPGHRTGNPAADALSAAISRHGLPKDSLRDMIDARIPALFGETLVDEEALKTALRETEGVVFALAALILGDDSDGARSAAAHAGVAQGLTRMLLKLPSLASRQKPVLPTSYLEARGIDLVRIHRGETSASFEAALADLRGAAARELRQFHEKAASLTPAAWPAFLPLALVKPYLKAMAARDFDPLHAPVALSPLRRFWRIWRAAQRKTL